MMREFLKFQKNLKPKKKGFTLVEFLFVSAIMLIMTATLFANNNSKKAASEVKGVGRQVVAQLRSLQSESLIGKEFSGAYAKEYKFSSGDPDNTKCTMSYYKNGDPSPIAGASRELNFDKRKVTFNAVSVSFMAPFGRPSASRIFIISSTRDGGATKYYICVSTSGSVTESQSLISAC